MKNIKNFLKIFSIKEIIEVTLIILSVFLILDMFNIPTLIINKFGIMGILLSYIIFVFIIFNKNIINLVKVNVFNYLDLFLIASLLATALYVGFAKYICYTEFKLSRIINLSIAFLICIFIRLIICKNKKEKMDKNENINVYDIKQLYDNNIGKGNELIFLEERDVSYDLLNRDKIILDLYNSINLCNNKEKFIISLTGKWGSGKTTILNIVKSKLDKDKFVVVDNFDIWKYNNEKALIFGILDEILKKLNVNFSTLEMKRVVNSCVSILTAKTDINIDFLLADKKVLDKIKLTINEYLNKNNKRVVFIIDNFERTNENNILTVLKTISTILNIDRFIYILSYDENEMKDIFNNKLQVNYDYMEKVIQLPLAVPSINQNDIDLICTQCLKNLLKYYGVTEEKIEEYIPAIKLFNKNIKDLRSFKRKVNSICNSCFYKDNFLNTMDCFLIELIKQENYELYCNIEKNYDFYVSFDQIAIYGYPKYDAKSFNKSATEYFDNLFAIEENKKYKDILSLLFPNVEKYFKTYRINGRNVEFWSESGYIVSTDRNEYNKSISERRIYNAKFFGLYFTKQQNEFINIDSKIREFIKWNNQREYSIDESIFEEFGKRLKEVLFLYKGFGQKYVIETLEIYVKDIIKNKLMMLIHLIGLQEYIDDSMIFMGLNARKRLEIVCAELIKQLSKEEINELKKLIEIDYKDMYFIRGILYWLKKENSYNAEEIKEEIFDLINESYSKLINNVIEKDINIYEKNNYSRYNIYCLMNDEKYRSQVKFINENTVFKFLADMITNSLGSSYGYSINLEEFNKITSYGYIDKILNKIDESKMTKLELFIKKVYEKSKEEKKNIMLDEKTIYSDEYIDIGKIDIEERKEAKNE